MYNDIFVFAVQYKGLGLLDARSNIYAANEVAARGPLASLKEFFSPLSQYMSIENHNDTGNDKQTYLQDPYAMLDIMALNISVYMSYDLHKFLFYR